MQPATSVVESQLEHSARSSTPAQPRLTWRLSTHLLASGLHRRNFCGSHDGTSSLRNHENSEPMKREKGETLPVVPDALLHPPKLLDKLLRGGSQQCGGKFQIGIVGGTLVAQFDPQGLQHPLRLLLRITSLQLLEQTQKIHFLQRRTKRCPTPDQVVRIVLQYIVTTLGSNQLQPHPCSDGTGNDQHPVPRMGTTTTLTRISQMQIDRQQVAGFGHTNYHRCCRQY